MNRLSITFIALLLAVATQVTDAQQSTGLDKLLAAAQHKAEIDGDLKGAIEEYKRVVDRAGPNRPLAAQALIGMAEAYRKLGDVEAQQLYARIVRDYRDQRDAFTTASARLSASSQATGRATLATQRVLDQGAPWDRVSPDGRYVARVDNSTGNLVLIELGAGKTRPLTFDGNPDEQNYRGPLASTFSRDGKQIAFQWHLAKENRYVLRVIGTDEGASKTPKTVHDNPDIELAPTDWSSDGRWIAVVIRRNDHTAQIGIVSPSDGSLRVLKTVDWSRVGGLRFSPDSSLLAYHRPPNESAFQRDVFIIAVDGSRETAVAASPGDDTLLEWTADGQQLLISSDRGGSMSVWSVPAFAHTPTSFDLVKSDTGIISSLGPTRTGALFYNLLPVASNIYVASFDSASGQLSSRPLQAIEQFKGFNASPEWSPDGRYLAYESRRDIPAPINVTRSLWSIMSVDNGHMVREFAPALSYGSMGRWSPDGRLFITRGTDLKGRGGVMIVDATSGAASLAVSKDTCLDWPLWASDGKSFFCYRYPERQLVQVDFLSRAVLRTYSVEGGPYGISPDGKYIVHYASRSLKVLALASGEVRELIRTSEPIFTATIDWTPDNRGVVFYGKVEGNEGMWLVPVDGRKPHKIDVGRTKAILRWRFSPTTGKVAFATDTAFGRLEVWKMENFLPLSSKSAAR